MKRFANKASSLLTAVLILTAGYLFVPEWVLQSIAAVDRGICSTADAGSSCSGVEVINNTNEELTAVYNRIVVPIASVTNSGNDYSGTATPALTAYVDGQFYTFKPSADNTGSSRVNWNGLGLVSLTTANGSALAAGELKSTSLYLIRYFGSSNQMRLMSVPGIGTLGDSVTVNGVAVTDIDIDDATPAAPAGGYNVKCQKDSNSPANVSCYVDFTGATDLTVPVGADSLLVNDASVPNAIREVLLSNFLKIINDLTEDTTPDEDNDFFASYDASASAAKKVKLTNMLKRQVREYCYALSDETTNLTTGTAKITFRAPRAITLTAIRGSVNTAPTGSTIIFDVNEGGTTIMSATKLSIDASEKTSTTAASAAVLSDTSLADDAEMTIDIDQIGSTIAGKGAKVCLYGRDT